jgi:hypothetical protein
MYIPGRVSTKATSRLGVNKSRYPFDVQKTRNLKCNVPYEVHVPSVHVFYHNMHVHRLGHET